jgi:hypothetical protein
MASVSVVPVAATDLGTHEQLDNAAHVEIATIEDEDYKWLTDRLDGLQMEVASLQSSQANRFTEMNTLLSTNQEQSRTLIQAQSEMITNLLSSVTALSEMAILKSIPPNSENSLPLEVPPEVTIIPTPEVEPVAVVPTPENRAPNGGKKRQRI